MTPLARLRAIASDIILVWGWKRAAVAFIAGLVSVLAMAPINAWPVLFITFPVMVWLIDGAGAGRMRGVPAAALTGWWFGFGYFIAGWYWIGHAFLVDADVFGWLLPVAVAGLPAAMAIYMALAFALARLLWTTDAWRIVSLAIGVTLGEWLRGHLFTGFPWNAFGYALTEPLALAQTASLVGLWGMSFLAVAIFASPAALVADRTVTRRPWIALACALFTLAAMGTYGAVRLSRIPARFVEGVKLRMMQPNLTQDVKFNYSAKQAVMAKYLALSDRATGPQASGIADATILIWPESAFPFFLTREADAMAQIAALLPQGTILITGAVRAPDAPPGARVTRAYNSIYVIDHDGTILSTYDKLHLVPFGEFLPFQETLEKAGLEQLTRIQGGYIAGQRRRAIDLPRAPSMLPLICYEAIFPGAIVPSGERPGWIVNLTNDGWFGISSGPYQHLQQVRVRAIEEGLPVVRSANTGISAIVDPGGRIIARLGLGQEGVLDAALPSAIGAPLYARTGDLPVAVFGVFATLFVLRRRSRSRVA